MGWENVTWNMCDGSKSHGIAARHVGCEHVTWNKSTSYGTGACHMGKEQVMWDGSK